MNLNKFMHRLKDFSNIATSIAFIIGAIWGAVAFVHKVVQLSEDDQSHEASVQKLIDDVNTLKTEVYFLKHCKGMHNEYTKNRS